jgi:hypothetical protein
MLNVRADAPSAAAPLAERLPNLVIIGAMKCGTTSLHYYLDRHPQISMSAEKETEFFIEDRNWSRGIDWYVSQFDAAATVRGETSPNYSAANRYPGVAARMHATIPDARIIYMVRDPVDRLVSHYVHNYSHGREGRSLHEAVKDDRYLERSMYWQQISVYLQHYDRTRIRVIDADGLRTHRAATLRGIFEFLGVDPDFYSPLYSVERHRSDRKRRKTRVGAWLATTRLARGIEALPQQLRWPLRDLLYLPFSRRIERPQLDPGERAELIERLRPDIRRFREFTGREFASWPV